MNRKEYKMLRVIFSPYREKVGIQLYDLINGVLIKRQIKNRLRVELGDNAENSKFTFCDDEDGGYESLDEIRFVWSSGEGVSLELAYATIELVETYAKHQMGGSR